MLGMRALWLSGNGETMEWLIGIVALIAGVGLGIVVANRRRTPRSSDDVLQEAERTLARAQTEADLRIPDNSELPTRFLRGRR